MEVNGDTTSEIPNSQSPLAPLPPTSKPFELRLVCLGLARSGKTSAIDLLAPSHHSEKCPRHERDVSVRCVECAASGCLLRIKELAGTLAVRARWSEHFSGAQGIVFVVNAAGDAYEVLAARETLHAALEHRRLANLPLLLLATNQDRSELARSCDALNLVLNLSKVHVSRPLFVAGVSIAHPETLRSAMERFAALVLRHYTLHLSPGSELHGGGKGLLARIRDALSRRHTTRSWRGEDEASGGFGSRRAHCRCSREHSNAATANASSNTSAATSPVVPRGTQSARNSCTPEDKRPLSAPPPVCALASD